MDGGSKDGTKEIIEKYNDRLSKWVSEPDKGIYDAMNKGVSMAIGDWVCFMNAGDVFESDDTISRVFSNKKYTDDVSVLYGDVVLDYLPYGYVLKRMNKLTGREIPLGLCHQATFTRLECLKEEPFDLSYPIYGDLHTFYSLWMKGRHFEYIPVPVAIFEAFEGVSSMHPERNFHESNRLQNRKWNNSIDWWKSLLRMILRKLSLMLLCKKIYQQKRYKHILAINEEYKSLVAK